MICFSSIADAGVKLDTHSVHPLYRNALLIAQTAEHEPVFNRMIIAKEVITPQRWPVEHWNCFLWSDEAQSCSFIVSNNSDPPLIIGPFYLYFHYFPFASVHHIL